MKKKFLSILIAVASVFVALGFSACKEHKSAYQVWLDNGNTGTEQDFLDWLKSDESIDNPFGFDFFLKTDGTYAVEIGEAYYSLEVEIPATYKGKPVTHVGNFSNDEIESLLKKITIPESVTSISAGAFYNCNRLEEITLPFVGETKDETNNSHFGFIFGAISSSYNEDYIPSSLKKVTITNATSIGNSAFANCSSLTNISLPDSLTSVGTGAFSNCSKLKYNASNDLKYLGNENNPYVYLADTIKESITTATIENGCKIIGASAFSDYKNLTSISIPNSITSIGDSAFYGCTNLTNITLPHSVERIGDSAFYGCTNLKYNEKNNLKYLGSEKSYYFYLAGTTTTSMTTANIEISCKFIGDTAFQNCSSLTSVTIPDGVKSISKYAFQGCSGLTHIIIPDSVTSIRENAFESCYKLTSIYYKGTVDSIYINESYTTGFESAIVYYYSETRPTESGNYWHFINGVPAKWQ